MNLHVLGIDPGDRWVGFATCRIEQTSSGELRWSAHCGVLDRQYWRLANLVDFLALEAKEIVVAEDYRQRPVGHQRFHDAQTPRLLGALEYAILKESYSWELVPAANVERLEQMPIAPILRKWREQGWDSPSHPSWKHARSAWLVVCNYWMKLGAENPLVYLVPPDKALKTLNSNAIPEDVPRALIANHATWRTR